MIDQAACRYQLQVRDSGKRHERAIARAQQKSAHRLGRCRACNAHRDRHAAVGLAQLGNDGAVKCRVDGLQHLGRLQTIERKLARAQFEAIRAVRAIKEVRVWSRNQAKREEFANLIGATACETAEHALRGADIVATATSAKDPVLESRWIADGTHINAMGSNQAQRRELPSDLIARAALIAVDSMEQAKIEAGDLLLAPVNWADPRIVELANLDARPAGTPVTIFKSIGLGVEDVAAAAFVYEQLS